MRLSSPQIPLCVALLLAGIYLLTTGGHTYASDEEQMFAVAEALVTRGTFAIGGEAGGAARYSNYGPGQPLLAVPLYAFGRGLAAFFPPEGHPYVMRAVVGWLNPLVTAATGGLVALAALRLGYSARPAVGVALVYGLATLAWPHSKTFFAEPLAAALTFAGFVFALGAPRPGRLLGAGLFAGLACVVKLQAGLALPFVGLWVLWRAWAAGARRPLPARLLPAVAWGLGALLGLGALGLYQWALFGSPLRSGYGGASGVFDGSLVEGLYGLTLSPGKGIVWYAPPLALLPLALALLWRRDRGAAALCGALVAATLLFYGKVIFWHGDGAWGPRYLNMALPFMALPLVALLEPPQPPTARSASSSARLPRLALLAAVLLAAPVQLGAELINLNAYLGVQRDAQRRYFEPSQSPILGHLRFAGVQLANAYALRLAPATLALAEGLSYSEGDREAGEQLPRWTLPAATLAVRPPAGAAALRVDLGLSGCLPAPLPPAEVRLALDGAPLGAVAACPPRRYALLLPPAPAELAIIAPGWRPAEAGVDREGELGVYITMARATAGGAPLDLAGRLVPIPPAPAGPVALRQWASDYRYGHWDLWPWYLAHAGLPARPSLALAALWAGLGASMLALGSLALRSALRRADRP